MHLILRCIVIHFVTCLLRKHSDSIHQTQLKEIVHANKITEKVLYYIDAIRVFSGWLHRGLKIEFNLISMNIAPSATIVGSGGFFFVESIGNNLSNLKSKHTMIDSKRVDSVSFFFSSLLVYHIDV